MNLFVSIRPYLAILGAVVAGGILLLLTYKIRRARPCWLFGHPMKHLLIEKKIWVNQNNPHGITKCPAGEWHSQKDVCWVTKWICRKEGCGEMGFWCAGDVREGAWKVEHGEVVPDEKEWMKWPT